MLATAPQLTLEQALDMATSLADAIMMVRKSTKFRAAYVAPMLECLQEDGAVHCSMRAVGAISSRMTAAKPALQQPPKKDTRIRAAYRAYPGWVFVSSDLKQGEPRVMAALSGDRNLKRDLLAGDLYDNLSSMTYGDKAYNATIAAEDVTSPHYKMRQASKFGFLAKSYGCQPRKLAGLLSVPEEYGQTIFTRWDGAYPDLAAYADRLNHQSAVVLESGWTVPLWDRWYVRADGLHCSSKPSRLGLNAATQGNQRYLIATAAHKVIDRGWSWALALFLHDEILGMVPAHMAEQFRQVLIECMTMDFHGVPIECDAKILGETWMPQPTDFDIEEINRGVADEWETVSLDDPDKERLLWSA
jgi:DNA polymerase-1